MHWRGRLLAIGVVAVAAAGALVQTASAQTDGLAQLEQSAADWRRSAGQPAEDAAYWAERRGRCGQAETCLREALNAEIAELQSKIQSGAPPRLRAPAQPAPVERAAAQARPAAPQTAPQPVQPSAIAPAPEAQTQRPPPAPQAGPAPRPGFSLPSIPLPALLGALVLIGGGAMTWIFSRKPAAPKSASALPTYGASPPVKRPAQPAAAARPGGESQGPEQSLEPQVPEQPGAETSPVAPAPFEAAPAPRPPAVPLVEGPPAPANNLRMMLIGAAAAVGVMLVLAAGAFAFMQMNRRAGLAENVAAASAPAAPAAPAPSSPPPIQPAAAPAPPPPAGGEPTEAQMRGAIQAQIDAYRSQMESMASGCDRMNSSQNPYDAIGCMMGSAAQSGGTDIRIVYFEKVGCARALTGAGYRCDYIQQINVPIMGSMGNARSIQSRRFVRTDSEWRALQD